MVTNSSTLLAIVFFILGALVVSILFPTLKDNRKAEQAIDTVTELKKDFTVVKSTVDAQVKASFVMNEKVEKLIISVNSLKDYCAGDHKVIKELKDECDELTKNYYDLKEILASKRSVIKVTGPIPVTIEEKPKKGKGLKALIKEK